MVFTCAGSYGREAQPHALYSRRPVNVKVSQRDDVTGKPRAIVRIAEDGGLLRHGGEGILALCRELDLNCRGPFSADYLGVLSG